MTKLLIREGEPGQHPSIKVLITMMMMMMMMIRPCVAELSKMRRKAGVTSVNAITCGLISSNTLATLLCAL
jgi:hypothetical protein